MVEMDTTTIGPPDIRGNVQFKSPLPAFTENQYKNLKFNQHYMKHAGTVFVGSEDASNNSLEINLNNLPSKNKRSQTGNFYGVLLHNSSTKNDSVTLNMETTLEIGFMEHPSENRLPYIY